MQCIMLMVLLGWGCCQLNCTRHIFISSLDTPQHISLTFTRSDNMHHRKLCFSYEAGSDLGLLALRLDYLPYLCVQAQNDNAMMNTHGHHYFVEIQVTRKCFSLWEEQETVQFVYELRESSVMFGFLVYDFMWQYGVIGLLILAFTLWVDSKFISAIRLEKQQ